MSIVIKEQLCGRDCEGCPHGPYAYKVEADGNGGQNWEYLGPASTVDGTGDDYESNLTNEDQNLVSDELEGIGDLFHEVKNENEEQIGVFEDDSGEWEFRIDGDEVVVNNDMWEDRINQDHIMRINKSDLENTAETFRAISEADKNVVPYEERGELEGLKTTINGDEIVFGLESHEHSSSRPFIGHDQSNNIVKSKTQEKNSDLLGPSDSPTNIEADDYVAKIDGTDSTYNYDRQFVEDTGGYDEDTGEYNITENGVYEVSDGDEKQPVVVYEGEVTEIDYNTLEILKESDKTVHDVVSSVHNS